MGSQCTQGGPPGPKGPELESQSIHGGPMEPRRPELGSRGTQETHWTQRPQGWIPGYLRSAHGAERPRGPRRVKPRVHRVGLNSNKIEAGHWSPRIGTPQIRKAISRYAGDRRAPMGSTSRYYLQTYRDNIAIVSRYYRDAEIPDFRCWKTLYLAPPTRENRKFRISRAENRKFWISVFPKNGNSGFHVSENRKFRISFFPKSEFRISMPRPESQGSDVKQS